MPAMTTQNPQHIKEASLTEDADHFCARFTSETVECVKNAYSIVREVYCSPQTGNLTTSIAEDIITLLRLQNDVLQEYMQENQTLDNYKVVHIHETIFTALLETHTGLLPLFLNTLQDCCAASNDFFRLSNKLEVYCENTLWTPDYYEFMPESTRALARSVVVRLSQDAVYAAERIQVFFIRQITSQTAIASEFFSPQWENDYTHNEVMLQLIQQLDQTLPHVETYLENEMLFHKVLVSSCKAIVCLYIRCLVEKADSVSRKRRGRMPFLNPPRALLRMQDDVQLLQRYFLDRAQDHTTLARIITNELRMLEVIYECLSVEDTDSLETMIVVLHKRTGADTLVTRYFVGDLWTLVTTTRQRKANRQQSEYLQGVIQGLEPDLEMVSQGMKQQEYLDLTKANGKRSNVANLQPFLRIDEMLKGIYEDRIAQGILPICWACLPKTSDDSNIGKEMVTEQIRHLSRKVVELQRSGSSRRSFSREVEADEVDKLL